MDIFLQLFNLFFQIWVSCFLATTFLINLSFFLRSELCLVYRDMSLIFNDFYYEI